LLWGENYIRKGGENPPPEIPREGSTPSPGIAFFFDKESNRAKSEIAMGKSNFSEWPTRAVVGGEGADSLSRHLFF